MCLSSSKQLDMAYALLLPDGINPISTWHEFIQHIYRFPIEYTNAIFTSYSSGAEVPLKPHYPRIATHCPLLAIYCPLCTTCYLPFHMYYLVLTAHCLLPTTY